MQSLCAEPLTTWDPFKPPSFRKIAIFINNFPTPPAIHISFRRLICPFLSTLLLTNHVLFLRRWGKATRDGFGVHGLTKCIKCNALGDSMILFYGVQSLRRSAKGKDRKWKEIERSGHFFCRLFSDLIPPLLSPSCLAWVGKHKSFALLTMHPRCTLEALHTWDDAPM